MNCPAVPPPTLAGFQDFITNVMAIPSAALPLSSPVVAMAYTVAMATVNCALCVTGIYALAVYNLGGSLVINFAPDQPNQTYFRALRGKDGLNIASFVPGVIAASGDESTSESILNPDFMKNFTMDDLQRLKDPYGRQYLAFAQDYGPAVWGLS